MNHEDLFPHPNSNAEIYRNMTPGDRAPVPDKHLQFITVNNDSNTAILGANNLTDRYWSGTIWLFDDCSSLNRDEATAASKCESTVIDGGFLDNQKFVIAEISGVLKVLEVPPNASDAWKPELQCTRYACQHDDSITSLAVFDNKSNFVTCGLDCCIKVWEATEFIAEYSYTTAHTNAVTNVDTKPKSSSEFISTSLDCEAIVWDVRHSKPACCLYKKDNCGLTAVACDPSSENVVAIGAIDGSVMIVDTRKPYDVLCESLAFRRPVHKLQFHPQRKDWLAGCSDDTVVKVIDPMHNLSLVYKDNRHEDFVRGLAWCKDELLTCAWDDTVLKHQL